MLFGSLYVNEILQFIFSPGWLNPSIVVVLKLVFKSELLNVILPFLFCATEASVIWNLYILLLVVSVTVIAFIYVRLGSAFNTMLSGFAWL